MIESPLQFIKPREPKPEWLKVRAPGSENYLRLRGIMRTLKLNTVCEDAHCPNIGECWHHGTATFMILGDVCTRACAYCAVAHGKPEALDLDEPERVAEAVARWRLKYAVITSVDRDDLRRRRRRHLCVDHPRDQAARARHAGRSADPRFPGRFERLRRSSTRGRMCSTTTPRRCRGSIAWPDPVESTRGRWSCSTAPAPTRRTFPPRPE